MRRLSRKKPLRRCMKGAKTLNTLGLSFLRPFDGDGNFFRYIDGSTNNFETPRLIRFDQQNTVIF